MLYRFIHILNVYLSIHNVCNNLNKINGAIIIELCSETLLRVADQVP